MVDCRQTSIVLVRIKAIAHKKPLRNGKTAIVNLHRMGSAFRLINKGADLD
jgi:hypothetical protein